MLYGREAYTYVKNLHAGPAPTQIAGSFSFDRLKRFEVHDNGEEKN